jgi:hypothetical protein
VHVPFTDTTAWLGDPDVVESQVRGLSSHEFGGFRAAGSSLERALSRPVAAADPRRFDRGAPLGATALSRHEPEAAADAEGSGLARGGGRRRRGNGS